MPESTVEGLATHPATGSFLDRPHSEDDRASWPSASRTVATKICPRRLDQDLLKQASERRFGELDARERQVICLRFGLKGGPPLSLRDTGQHHAAEREGSRQIEENTMRKLRQPGRAARLVEFLDEPAPVLMNAAAELRTCAMTP